MRMMLRISVVLNCGLIGCLVFLLLSGRAWRQAEAPAEAEKAMATIDAAPPATATPPVEAKRFHWSQIESSDYRAYVANLRGIGCPEQTIRDIIGADVDTLYAPRRKPLEKLVARGGAASSVAEVDLRELRRQETDVIAALFGLPPAATNTPSEVVEAVPPGEPREISTPMVFQDVDLSALKLEAGQQEAINNLRERFLQRIGGTNADPADPAYAQRWRNAQPEIDQDLRGMIGASAWMDYQLMVARAGSSQP